MTDPKPAARPEGEPARPWCEKCQGYCKLHFPTPGFNDYMPKEKAPYPSRFDCMARASKTDPPQDCAWPWCKCEPTPEPPTPEPCDRLAKGYCCDHVQCCLCTAVIPKRGTPEQGSQEATCVPTMDTAATPTAVISWDAATPQPSHDVTEAARKLADVLMEALRLSSQSAPEIMQRIIKPALRAHAAEAERLAEMYKLEAVHWAKQHTAAEERLRVAREDCARIVESFRERPEMPTLHNIAAALRATEYPPRPWGLSGYVPILPQEPPSGQALDAAAWALRQWAISMTDAKAAGLIHEAAERVLALRALPQSGRTGE